jgi:hypothetical protein
MGLCYIYSTQIKYYNLDYYILYSRPGSACNTWDYARVKNMLKNLIVIRHFISNSTLTQEQNTIIQKKIHVIIRLTMKKLFSIHRLDKYSEIKKGIIKSGLYPIKNYQGNQFKKKIHLLNFSFDLFCLPLLIKQFFYDIEYLLSK